MHIARVETFPVGVPKPHRGGINWLFIRLTTNDGIVGWGECNVCAFREAALVRLVEDLCEHFVLGRHNPFDMERMWARLYSGDDTPEVVAWTNFRRAGPLAMQAVAAIDMACWDIVGKALGQPVHNLLGGRCRERVRSYTYIYDGWTAGESPEKAGEAALALKERGFTAFKLDPIPPFFPQAREIGLRELSYTEAVLSKIRDTVGDECDILVGTHGQLNTQSAIRFARAIEPFDPLWFEEPIPPENAAEMSEVARHTSVPIAAGERLSTRWDFKPLLDSHSIKIVQINVGLNGLLEAKKIAAMAETSYAQIAPWIYCGPVAAAAALQLDIATPNFLIQEGIDNWGGFTGEIQRDPIRWEKGYLIPPDAPGLGVELDERVLRRHPMHDHRQLREAMAERRRAAAVEGALA
jgi:2-dehydro-3-deoxyphosphogalactonate aldolase